MKELPYVAEVTDWLARRDQPSHGFAAHDGIEVIQAIFPDSSSCTVTPHVQGQGLIRIDVINKTRRRIDVAVCAESLDGRVRWTEPSSGGPVFLREGIVVRERRRSDGVWPYRPLSATFSVEREGTEVIATQLLIDGEPFLADPASSIVRVSVSGGQLAAAEPVPSLFISYAHDDAHWLKQFETMLRPLCKELRIWSDRDIQGGGRWQAEIDAALASCTAGLILATPNTFASSYITEKELPYLVQRSGIAGTKVLWAAVAASFVDYTPLAGFQCLNDPRRPIAGLSGHRRTAAIQKACLQLLRVLATPAARR